MSTARILPFTPPDPFEAIRAHMSARERAEAQLVEAKTPDEKRLAQFWIDSADRQIAKWQAVADRKVQP